MTTATRMWALDGPTFTLPASFLVLNGEGDVTIPVPCFLIEHPRGLVLFDTGIAEQAVTEPEAVFSAQELAFNHLNYPPELRPSAQMEKLGIEPEQITHVVMSHLHHDHTGGMRRYPTARFYCGVAEMPHAWWPEAAQRGLHRLADLTPVRDFDWEEVDGDLDLFADGSITLLTLPGHTPGSLGVLVRLPYRTFLLTGDALHLRQGLERGLPMGGDWSTEASVRSIRKIKHLQHGTGAEVWINHDPEDWAHYTADGREFQ